jgi:signal transduction histidine kinase
MTGARGADLQQQRLRYFGSITASLSHEINNVLAIVGELSGLIDDLVAGAVDGAALDPARFKAIGDKLAHHVERGKGYVGNLNRFAHSVDHSWAAFDAGEAVAAVVEVCERFARLGEVELRLERTGDGPQLDGSQYDFEHLVFRVIDAALAAADRGAEISVELAPDAEGGRLAVATDGPTPEAAGDEVAARVVLAESQAAQLGAGLERREEPGGGLRLTLALPRTLGAPPDERSA